MLSLAHTATGALIATKVGNPWVAVPLILASHYLEDFITHWDCGTGLSKGIKSPTRAIIEELGELVLSAVFIYLFFETRGFGINLQAWGGAFISLIPDFVEAPKNFLKWEPAILKPLNNFHRNFHNSTPNMILGLTPQLVLLFVVALIATY